MRKLVLIVLLLSLTANLQLGGVRASADPSASSYGCPGAPISRLHVGQQAVIVVDQLRMRALPAVSTGILRNLNHGTEVRVISGPSCNRSLAWWRIETVNGGLRGWVAEGRWDGYFVIPVYGEHAINPDPIAWATVRGFVGVRYWP